MDTPKDGEYDAVVIGSGYGGSVAACRISMAGFNVCLMEKGRRWEARDFPTNIFNVRSAVRVETGSLGLNFGPKDALVQVHQQDDSLAAVACGLGGGSLVNAGVMIPTPVRARRDAKWPVDWEKDWKRCEALASDMLRIQKVPLKFQNTKIMEDVVEDDYNKNTHNPLELSVNFNGDGKDQETGTCLACGNCVAGCQYNAKNSTDKNYLLSAIQAGCTIKTECEVQFIVRNRYEDSSCDEDGRSNARSRRRWLVFFNDIDYVASDIVILSAGVFGTAKLLFQSQMRGLSVSQKLGFGLSCNGNNVAYVVRSLAPLNSSGLNKQQFSRIPFPERPGPSISSSYTSSLGITIQSAVIPTAYPSLLLKGLSYKWLSEGWLLHEIVEKIKHFMGLKCRQEMILNAMGYDDGDGRVMFDRKTNKILFQPPLDPLLPRKIEAFQKIAKKLGGKLFMSPYRSTSVHLLGGCVASCNVSSGVCNSDGQVFDSRSQNGVHPCLYICDASMIPCSVGINPCLTIATVAEHVSRRVIQNVNGFIGSRKFKEKQGSISSGRSMTTGSEVMVQETIRGQVGGMPCTAYLVMRFKNLSRNLGTTSIITSHHLLRGRVGGHVVCKAIEIDKLYIIQGDVDLCKTDARTPYTQYIQYHLLLAASSGSRYLLEGRKIMNPYLLALYAWKESTTLNVTLRKINDDNPEHGTISLQGKLHISLIELLKSIWRLEGGSKSRFISLFLQSMFRTYILQEPRGRHLDFTSKDLDVGSYPNSTMHEIKTYDGLIIFCQHWESRQSTQALMHEKKPYPVMLINGYSMESYSLPTEPNDLVRTMLKEGHDVWLLRSRVHPSYSLNSFSIEDIGRFDIAAAIDKIIQFYGDPMKVHIVAHCVGGVAIHIAIMGGHVTAKKIASLSCTNSSMFFKLTTSSLVKMWLPLIPMSMAVLGKNKTLPLLEKSTNIRHSLLKSIACLIPRYERCTCDECEVFSGIFGNAFWHENVSHTMHNWLNKVNVTHLPMAGFTHLRKICNAGFIVDGEGKNKYMIHPERMTLPTLYLSGGRTLLVTPETSFLANKYMKLHQPSYRHERVVVDGFGHSDLLIGEKSSEKVFPHIIAHIRLAESRNDAVDSMEKRYKKEVLAWFITDEDGGRLGIWVFCLIIFALVVVLKSFYFF